MKRKLLIMMLVITLLIASTFYVFAGGDKVLGSKGIGNVNQYQVMDPPPFNP